MADSSDKTIFISRAGADKDVAIRIAAFLRTAGYKTILQDENFGHTSFMENMDAALRSGARVAAILSEAYLANDNCKAEWQAALTGDPLNKTQRLIVFRVTDCAPVGLLKPIPYINLHAVIDDPIALANLVRNAAQLRERKEQPAAKDKKHRNAAPAHGTLIDPDANWEVSSFTGREKALNDLRDALFATGAAAVTQAVTHGMGGVGKSALAREYGWRNRADYSVLWWLNAEKEDGIVDGLIRLGARYIPDLDKVQDRGAAAKTALEHVFAALDRRALLVFDNIEDRTLLAKWRPRANAHVLATSRIHGWSKGVAAIEIEEWPPNEARDYLLKESGRTDIKPEDAVRIAATLGHLPLALAHAAAFLRDNPAVTAARYIARTDELMDQVPDGADYPKAVYATFQQALASAEKKGPGAAAILCLCAFYAPDDIPLELLEQEPEAYPDNLAPVFDGDPDALALRAAVETESIRERALSALASVSLIDLKPETRSFSVHRLVQASCRDLVKPARDGWAAAGIRAANNAFPHVEFSDWPLCERLTPHAESLSLYNSDDKDVALPRLFNQTGLYLQERAEFSRAEPLIRRALAIDETARGPNHPNVATYLNNLAGLLRETNRPAEAEPLYRRALAIDEKAYGPDHLEVATDLNNLAALLRDTDRFAEAEPLIRRALAIDETARGPDHHTVAIRLNNLAGLLRETNRLAEAEPLFRRALAISEKAPGIDHPTVAIRLNNLAELLRATNRFAEAEPFYRRALAIDEMAYGPDHPDVATDLNNLALLLHDTNRLAEAVPMAERAAAIFRASLGEEHPNFKTAAETARVLRAKLDEA